MYEIRLVRRASAGSRADGTPQEGTRALRPRLEGQRRCWEVSLVICDLSDVVFLFYSFQSSPQSQSIQCLFSSHCERYYAAALQKSLNVCFLPCQSIILKVLCEVSFCENSAYVFFAALTFNPRFADLLHSPGALLETGTRNRFSRPRSESVASRVQLDSRLVAFRRSARIEFYSSRTPRREIWSFSGIILVSLPEDTHFNFAFL